MGCIESEWMLLSLQRAMQSTWENRALCCHKLGIQKTTAGMQVIEEGVTWQSRHHVYSPR